MSDETMSCANDDRDTVAIRVEADLIGGNVPDSGRCSNPTLSRAKAERHIETKAVKEIARLRREHERDDEETLAEYDANPPSPDYDRQAMEEAFRAMHEGTYEDVRRQVQEGIEQRHNIV